FPVEFVARAFHPVQNLSLTWARRRSPVRAAGAGPGPPLTGCPPSAQQPPPAGHQTQAATRPPPPAGRAGPLVRKTFPTKSKKPDPSEQARPGLAPPHQDFVPGSNGV